MVPRFAADYRTMVWVFVLAPTVMAAQFAHPEWVPYLSWLSCYFAISAGVIAHNHNHSPTFKSKGMNQFFANWISVLYGFPTFAWIPTHNLNHHKFVNTPGDATITWRYTNKHVWYVALTYFFISAYFQSEPTSQFLAKAKEKNPTLYRRIQFQYVFWISGYVVLLTTALALHGVRTGLYLFVWTVAFPAVLSLWTIMLFNYEQHVHTNSWSKYNHSRNFVSPVLNFLLFNNGFHAAHHMNAGLHWTKLPALHAEFADKVDPSLNQKSVWWYWFRQYLLAPFLPSLGTQQMGGDPESPPGGKKMPIATADVELGEAGTNAVALPVANAES